MQTIDLSLFSVGHGHYKEVQGLTVFSNKEIREGQCVKELSANRLIY